MPAPDMRAHLEGLVGQTLPTIADKLNRIVRLEGTRVIVATEENPTGAPVSLSLVQGVVDRLHGGEEVVLDPQARSAFVAAVLQTMDDVEVLTNPRRARLRYESPQARADRLVISSLDALGGEASRTQIIDWAMANGGFDAARLAPTDAGRSLADQDMTWALSRAVEGGTVDRPERAFYRLAESSASPTSPDPQSDRSGSAPEQGKHRSRKDQWMRDELILAFDLYQREGASRIDVRRL